MSILEGSGRVHIDSDCRILSADSKKGTDFEASFIVDGEEYKVTIHSSKKLNEDQCLGVLRQNLDMMAILSESYLLHDTVGINYNPQSNVITREYKVLNKQDKEIDVADLGGLLEDRLRSNEWKKDENFVEANASSEDQKDKEKVEEDDDSVKRKKNGPSERRIETKEKIKHLQKALELYHLWKRGGGHVVKQPTIGELIIERTDIPQTVMKTLKESWWEQENEDLEEKLEIRKDEMDPKDFAVMHKRAIDLRKEAVDLSDQPGWSLGKDFADSLAKDEVLREAWNRFLIKEKKTEMDLYKEHMELILNNEPEEVWQNKKAEVVEKFQPFFDSVKDQVLAKIQKLKFFEEEEKIFKALIETQPWQLKGDQKEKRKEKEKGKEKDDVQETKSRDLNFKNYYKTAKSNAPHVIQYRSRALLRKDKSNKPGWTLDISPKVKEKPGFEEKWSKFIAELGLRDEADLYTYLLFHGLNSKDNPEDLPPFEILIAILQDYFKVHEGGYEYQFISSERAESYQAYYEAVKNPAAIRNTLRRISAAMKSAS